MHPLRPHVWSFDITTEWFDRLADSGLASADELARAATFTDAIAARRLLARRSALRLLLGDYVDIEPQEVRVVTAPGGKPVLVPSTAVPAAPSSENTAITFSVAHSGDLYCVALGTVSSLGLDVERHRSVARAHAIAERWFGAEEARHLTELPEDRLDAEFLRVWTGKEALAKRHGAGLRLMRGDVEELDVEASLRDRRLHYFGLAEGYAAAVASTDVIEDVKVIRPEGDPWTT